MTTPDIVPFLNRVKGIITDEGGLTCHAAIIAREMKIPCLVATNNSTKIFNNSENILLNANKGFAKKLIN
jgi:pyruvate,water dikinase